jgi:uncharacterized protein (DUF58 family)
MKVRKGTFVLLKTALFLLVFGIILTSYELVALSAFPILLLLTPTLPVRVRVLHHTVENAGYVGEEFKVTITLKASGFGIVKISHELPDHFKLSDGSNAVAKFIVGTNTFQIVYSAIPTKRGKYDLDRLVIQVENPFLTGRLFISEIELPVHIEVRQRIPKILKIGVHRGIATSPMPDIDISKIGVPGTDFREIREYVTGDPVKFINWKASARKNEVMVNQYEVEGKKSIWIFLDANPYMMHGKLIRNYFEAAVEATNALAYYFTQRGFRVGLYIVGYGRYIYPDTGRRQFRRIGNELIKIEPSEKFESMEQAIENAKSLLITYKPLVYFITRVEYSMPVKAVLKASKVSKKVRKVPVEVISLVSRDVKTEKNNGESDNSLYSGSLPEVAVKTLINSVESRIRASGARVVEWDISTPLTQVLLREVIFA